jgi:hypothetical protein
MTRLQRAELSERRWRVAFDLSGRRSIRTLVIARHRENANVP